MRAYLRFAILAALLGLVKASGAEAVQGLSTIASVRTDAARGVEAGLVTVRGTITYRKDVVGVAFVQDKTGGIAFYPRGVEGAKQTGKPNVVEITGVPMVRDGMLMLCAPGSKEETPLHPSVTYLPNAAVEMRLRKVELSMLTDLHIEAELIQTTGVMRKVIQKTKTGMTVEVTGPGGYVVVRLPWVPEDAEVNKWVNRQVSFKGVVASRAERRLLPADADAVIFVSNPEDWVFQPGVIEKVLDSAPVKVSQLWRTTSFSQTAERVNVQGVITSIRGSDTIDLSTTEGSVVISSRQALQFHVGQRISAACAIVNKRGITRLVDGVCRGLGEGTPVPPLVLNSGADASKVRYGTLVRFSGTVRDVFRTQDRGRLLVALKEGGTCAVLLEPPATVKAVSENSIGSKYDFTGIFESGKDGRTIAEGANFVLHLRSDADVVLTGSGPWWTRQRLTTALWALAIVVGLAVPGTFFLRWKIWRQEQKIRQFERANASAQERKRIAGEFHDSLQQELASASLHLETLAEACLSSPQRMPVLLADLAAMLRHCQIEARNLIWDLRADDEYREGVSAPIKSWLAMRQRLVRNTSLHFETKGEEMALPADSCRHVMRITQEAVNNAITHAGASRVSVKVSHEKDRLEVLVEDDGQGFNTSTAPSIDKGHYGLSMLEERAQRIQARIDFRSEVNHGTLVRLVVPHPPL